MNQRRNKTNQDADNIIMNSKYSFWYNTKYRINFLREWN